MDGTSCERFLAAMIRAIRFAALDLDCRTTCGPGASYLLGLPVGQRGYRYPLWQFVPSGVLPRLAPVLRQLAADGPWFSAAWLLGPNSRLGTRPLDILRNGDSDAVIQAARAYGEEGA